MDKNMKQKTRKLTPLLPIINQWFITMALGLGCLFILFSFAHQALANDSAVEVTPSGLQFKIQNNIMMEQEELSISTEKIEVTYRFKNQSRKDIITEVAFPIPEYSWSIVGRSVIDFADFTVEVDGKKISHSREVKAFVNGRDCTTQLAQLNISIADFGGFDSEAKTTFVDRLKSSEKKILVGLGILTPFIDSQPDYVFPNWSVSIKYYWKQIFPAGKTVIIKHSYGPYVGFEDAEAALMRQDGCIDEGIAMWINTHLTRGLASISAVGFLHFDYCK
jgi:hypothetical protein